MIGIAKIPRTRRRRWFRRIAVFVSLALLGTFLYAAFVPLPESLGKPADGSMRLLDCEGRLLEVVASTRSRAQMPAALEQISPLLARVTVALEDHRFYEHAGVDLRAVGGAALRNLRNGRIVSGGSTITQQTIKLAGDARQRSYLAKIYENFAALRLEREWSKQRILEEYLNRCHYGNRFVGPEAAAQAYFGKTAGALTLGEAIYLAGLPQAPTRYNPWRHPDKAQKRYERSLARLEELGVITAEQSRHCRAEPPRVERHVPPQHAPHFADMVANGLPEARGDVFTTLDLPLQQLCERLAASHLPHVAPFGARQVAIVVLDNRDGSVRALVGSRDFGSNEGQINGATIFRSSGSTLKPFLYLRAIETGKLTAATLLPDTPDAVNTEFPDYDPINYDHTYRGPVRVREALGNSLNVPAVVALGRVGARETFQVLQNWGLRFARPFETYGAGLILGNAEVSLLDLTSAYAALARRGVSIEPRLLRDAPVVSRRVASAAATDIICDILCDNDARRLTFGGNSPLAFNVRVPCKTGTSSGYRDAWTVGFTARHTVGVWVGNFDGSPMDEIAAIQAAAPLWRCVVDHLLKKDPSVPEPGTGGNLVRAGICSLTGLRPTAASPRVVNEWFLPGTEPVEDASRQLVQRDGGIQWLLPKEYALWCKSPFNNLGAVAEDEGTLKILSPMSESVFVLDRLLPRSQQQLQLKAVGARDAVMWKVDGQVVTNQGGYHLWPLMPGTHEAVAESGTQRVVSRFTVETGPVSLLQAASLKRR